MRALHAPEGTLGDQPGWLDRRARDLLAVDAGLAVVIGPDEPDLMADVPPERAAGLRPDSMRLIRAATNGDARFCVIGYATPGWASRVFPDLPVADAVAALERDLLDFARIGPDDPPDGWARHVERLRELARELTAARPPRADAARARHRPAGRPARGSALDGRHGRRAHRALLAEHPDRGGVHGAVAPIVRGHLRVLVPARARRPADRRHPRRAARRTSRADRGGQAGRRRVPRARTSRATGAPAASASSRWSTGSRASARRAAATARPCSTRTPRRTWRSATATATTARRAPSASTRARSTST